MQIFAFKNRLGTFKKRNFFTYNVYTNSKSYTTGTEQIF